MTETKTILCVDDEQNILNSLKRLLFMEEYEVLTAGNGTEALSVLEKRPAQLIVSDQRMPEMTGIQLLQQVKKRWPDTIRVILSGYVDVNIIVEAINKGEVYRFLTKPWNDEELKSAIRQCLTHFDIVRLNAELALKVQQQNDRLRKLNESLEEMVRERTFSLRMSQDILEDLPIPLIAVDDARRVILCNTAARDAFPSLATQLPGTEMEVSLPGTAVRRIDALLAGAEAEPSTFDLTWDEKNVHLSAHLLKYKNAIRGCVLLVNRGVVSEQ